MRCVAAEVLGAGGGCICFALETRWANSFGAGALFVCIHVMSAKVYWGVGGGRTAVIKFGFKPLTSM